MPLKLQFVALCCLTLLLTACAQVPTEMHYRPHAGSEGQDRLWPGLPEIPRYRYAGQLTGEQNFAPASDPSPAFGEKLLRWVAGLADGQRRQPQVLIRPQSGMVDASGRILVTDVGRQAVFVFDVPNARLQVWRQADGGAGFSDPIGITAGRGREILVSDATLRRIVRLDAQGVPLGSFGDRVLKRPTGLVRDPDSGRIFCVDTGEHDIKVFNEDGLLVDRIGLRGKAPGEFNAPTHIALAGDRLYVTDTLNARVQVLSLEGDPIDQIGKRGLYVGNLTRPKGVAVDADGHVYVVESYYDHLLIFDRESRFLLPIGGSGSAIGQFYLPAGVWTDTQGRIYVADMYNGRVVLFQYLGS